MERNPFMPIYRKDSGGTFYKLFPEDKFRKASQPDRDLCLYFDEVGRNGVADLEKCLLTTQPSTEEEYNHHRSRYLI